MSLGSFILQLREDADLSQEDVAKKLGVSRPTVAKLEKDEYSPTVDEARAAADLFGLTLQDLLTERLPNDAEVTLPKSTTKPHAPALRIHVPQKRLDVFKQVLLYILGKVGAKPNVGETVLYKLLYFIDFDFYEKYEEQLIGATYIKNHYGPTPVEFKKIVEDMVAHGELDKVKSKFFAHEQKKYLPLKSPNLAMIDDGRAIAHIDGVLAKYADMTAAQLSDLSHRDVPWMTADEGKPIDYESVFYRTPEFSVRQYDDV